MTAPVELVGDGFALVLAIALPLVIAAVLGALAGVLVTRMFGVQDAATAALARGAAVLVALMVLGASWAGQVKDFTATSWATLAERASP
jgi:flagellar biosynthesis protein FliQ